MNPGAKCLRRALGAHQGRPFAGRTGDARLPPGDPAQRWKDSENLGIRTQGVKTQFSAQEPPHAVCAANAFLCCCVLCLCPRLMCTRPLIFLRCFEKNEFCVSLCSTLPAASIQPIPWHIFGACGIWPLSPPSCPRSCRLPAPHSEGWWSPPHLALWGLPQVRSAPNPSGHTGT